MCHDARCSIAAFRWARSTAGGRPPDGIEHTAQASALAAPDQGGPEHERTHQDGPAPPQPRIQWGSSSPPFARSSLHRPGSGALQPGRSQAGERHSRCSSPSGDDPTDRRKEARSTPCRG
ncbi:hypothetical protein NDU88_005496 [Pleurodeles waltl]|uniref:Uncharacterized protein n=1 Tax=Pleurodeles waltl TaxID=8319 RepID=A0AAV7TU60_PLEWA|nr:hypothetical protein NDU88_005496 [Pleurodeles waltl]